MASRLGEKITELIKTNEVTYSFEVTPDVSPEEINDLEVKPIFFSVTWHAKSHLCQDLDIAPLETVILLKSKQEEVLLHLTCDLMTKNYLESLLKWLQDRDIRNLFIILGEQYDEKSSEFKNTSELIKYIRMKTGEYFCIGIAGFPGGSEDRILQTKEKVDSGADFIITQAFFEPKDFGKYLDDCKRVGIRVPIIPGLFFFEGYAQLDNFIKLCKVNVSNDILERVRNIEEERSSSSTFTKSLINTLHLKYQANHCHFFTLNKVHRICKLINDL